MKFLFRADASIQIGSGHIMRCLTLANRLRERGHSVRFIMREHAGHLRDTVLAQGFECVLLPAIVSPQVFDNLPHSAWLGTTQAQDIADCAYRVIVCKILIRQKIGFAQNCWRRCWNWRNNTF